MLNEIPLYNKILVISIDFIGIWLVAVVYNSEVKRKLKMIFLGMMISMFFWVNPAYLAHLIGKHQIYLSLIFIKIAWFSTPVLFVLLYFLVVFYLNKEKKYLLLSKVILFSGLIVSLTTAFTNLIIKDVNSIGSDLIVIYGRGMFPFLVVVFFFMCVPLYLLFKEYIKSDPKEKIKIEHLLVGILIFYIANTIFNIIFPVFLKVVYLYWIGDYSSIVFLGFTAYAIVRRELFGIKIIFTATLVSLIAVLLTLDIFIFTSQLLLQLYKTLILVIFIYFGYLLINSVLREIKYKEKVKRAYEVEKKAHEELKKLDEAKTQFMMATQHHLRTPLTAMIGYLDLVFGGSYGKIYPKIKNVLLKFKISTQRLNKVVNELLDISQFQLGKKVVSLQPDIKIEPILREVMEELQFEVKAKNLYLKFQKPVLQGVRGKLPTIKADPEKLKVALANIIDNAVKYTPKGGIVVAVKKMDSKILVSIKDTGIGIPNGKEKNLFGHVFERGKGAKKVHTTGKGIGLYITAHIIKAHNGKIWVKSEGKGKGSTFYMELPVG